MKIKIDEVNGRKFYTCCVKNEYNKILMNKELFFFFLINFNSYTFMKV